MGTAINSAAPIFITLKVNTYLASENTPESQFFGKVLATHLPSAARLAV